MPISSYQISQIIAAQQQQAMMFQAQATGPQPVPGISQYPPQFAPGMAMSAAAQQPMGAFTAPGGFSYGAQRGPSIGAHVGAMGFGAMGQMGSAVGGMALAGGLLDMAGVGGGALGALGMLDPLGAALTVGGAATGAGMGLGGAAALGGLAAAPIAAGMGGIYMAGRAGRAGFEQQQALGAQLSGLQFANMQAPTGRGFGPQQMQRIGATMRSFAAADPFTNMQDMQGMMQQFTDMGMAQGIRDAEEFASKFKKMTDTVRSMAMAMGTSMQEASQTFGQMRQAGFYTAQDVMGNTAQMMVLRGAGMSMEQFGQMQQTGAGIARAQGMLGTAGAMGMTQMTQRLMLDPTRETLLMNMTGAPDFASAAAATSERLMGATGQFFRGQQGRAMLAALGETKGGEFTGGIDQEQLQKVMSGQVGLQDLSKMGMRRLEEGGRASFVRQEEMMRQSAMSMQEDMVPAIMRLLEKTTGGNQDTMAILAKRFMGMDELLLSQAKELADRAESDRGELRRRMAQEASTEALQAEISRNRSLRGIGQRIRGGAEDLFERVAGQPAATTAATLDRLSMLTTDAVWGISRTGMTRSGMEATIRAGLAGGGTASGRELGVAKGFWEGEGTASGAIDPSEGGLAGRVAAATGDRGKGVAFALALQAGAPITASGLGISEGRDADLQKVATALQSDSEYMAVIAQAQEARRAGRSGKVERLSRKAQRMMEDKSAAMGVSMERVGWGPGRENVGGSKDWQLTPDKARIMALTGGESLVRENEKDVRITGGYTSVEDAKQAAMREAVTKYGALGGLSDAATKILKAIPGMGLAVGVSNKLVGQGIWGAGGAEFLATGGAGANVIAGFRGDEKKIGEAITMLREVNELGEEERIAVAKRRLSDITGRQDYSDEDIKASLKYMERYQTAPEELAKRSQDAYQWESMRGDPAVRKSMAMALSSVSFGAASDEALKLSVAAAGGHAYATEGKALIERLSSMTPEELATISEQGGVGAAGAQGAQALASMRKLKTEEEKMAFLRDQYGEDTIKAILAENGKSGSVSAEEIARQAGAGLVIGTAAAGATSAEFRGGTEAEIVKMQQDLHAEIKGNTTLIKELTDRVVGSKGPTLSDALGASYSYITGGVEAKPP